MSRPSLHNRDTDKEGAPQQSTLRKFFNCLAVAVLRDVAASFPPDSCLDPPPSASLLSIQPLRILIHHAVTCDFHICLFRNIIPFPLFHRHTIFWAPFCLAPLQNQINLLLHTAAVEASWF